VPLGIISSLDYTHWSIVRWLYIGFAQYMPFALYAAEAIRQHSHENTRTRTNHRSDAVASLYRVIWGIRRDGRESRDLHPIAPFAQAVTPLTASILSTRLTPPSVGLLASTVPAVQRSRSGPSRTLLVNINGYTGAGRMTRALLKFTVLPLWPPSPDRIKAKPLLRQEFVVGGWIGSKSSRSWGPGSLLVACYEAASFGT